MHDVVVLGGGPAGSAAAGMLARLGHDVLLLTRAARHSLGEAIPPSTSRLLSELGLLDSVNAAGFVRSRGNTVWWEGGPARVEPFAAEAPGWQVERSRFDEVLLAAAMASGAAVRGDAAIREVVLDGEGKEVRWGEAGAAHSCRARWVLDCTGRAGVLARRMGRRAVAGRATFALHAVWEAERWDLPDDSHTLVETTPGGWAWSVPVHERVRHITAMVDAPQPGAASLRSIYDAELAATTHLARLVRDARMVREPGGLSAAPYTADTCAGPGWLLVGDASSFIDPLSSFGVKKALASAWLAGVAVHTALTDERMTGPATALFDRREREAFAEVSRQASRVWTDGTPDSGRESLGDSDVRAAFQALKAAPFIRLRAAADAVVEDCATVRGNLVVLEPHVLSPWHVEGIRYLNGIVLPRLVELAPHASQVPDLYEQYVRGEGPTDLRDFLGALSVLLARGVLRQE